MKAIHLRIKVTYNFKKKINQKVNLGRHPTPAHLTSACPDIAILKDGFEKKKKKKKKKKNVQ